MEGPLPSGLQLLEARPARGGRPSLRAPRAQSDRSSLGRGGTGQDSEGAPPSPTAARHGHQVPCLPSMPRGHFLPSRKCRPHTDAWSGAARSKALDFSGGFRRAFENRGWIHRGSTVESRAAGPPPGLANVFCFFCFASPTHTLNHTLTHTLISALILQTLLLVTVWGGLQKP